MTLILRFRHFLLIRRPDRDAARHFRTSPKFCLYAIYCMGLSLRVRHGRQLDITKGPYSLHYRYIPSSSAAGVSSVSTTGVASGGSDVVTSFTG